MAQGADDFYPWVSFDNYLVPRMQLPLIGGTK